MDKVNQEYFLSVKLYRQTVKFVTDQIAEYEYIYRTYNDWVCSDIQGNIWEISSRVDPDAYIQLKKLSYKPHIIFRTCPAHIAYVDSYIAIYCDDIFLDYIFVVHLNKKKISIFKRHENIIYSDMRFVGHIIDEVIALKSYFGGYKKVHAAACEIDGKGVLIQGEKGAGKTTLLLHLLLNGASFLNNDITRLSRHFDELKIHAWPSKVNIGIGTIEDNNSFKHLIDINEVRMKDVRMNQDDNKLEFFRDAFIHIVGCNSIRSSILKCIVRPHFSTDNEECVIVKSPNITIDELLSPICDTWLPIVSEKDLQHENCKKHFEMIKVPIFDFYYGTSKTEPGKQLIEFIKQNI